VDLDTDAAGQPAPKGLVPYATTFTTFGPEQIGQSAESYSSPAIVVMGDRGYLAVPQPNVTGLKIYDVSDPTTPTEVLPAQPVTAIGHPYDLVGEETSPLTSGRIVALTTGPIGVPYRPSNVFVYDVATDQPQWIGAVTLGNSPSDGVTRRTVMKDGILYAATAGIGKGIQVVDLQQTLANYQAATANGTTSPEYYDMLSKLGLEGQGFGQDAIVDTIYVHTGLTDDDHNSRLWDLAIGDITVDGGLTRLVAATGATGLAMINPLTSEILSNGPVRFENGASALVWGYGVGLTTIGALDVAVLIGFNTNTSDFQLVTVNVTDPRHPIALGSFRLTGTQVDPRSRLAVKDAVAYIGGSNRTTSIDVSDVSHTRATGEILELPEVLHCSRTT